MHASETCLHGVLASNSDFQSRLGSLGAQGGMAKSVSLQHGGILMR